MLLGGKIMIINNTYKKHVIKWLNEKNHMLKNLHMQIIHILYITI